MLRIFHIRFQMELNMQNSNLKPTCKLVHSSTPVHDAPEVRRAADLPNRPGSALSPSCTCKHRSASLECGCRPQLLPTHRNGIACMWLVFQLCFVHMRWRSTCALCFLLGLLLFFAVAMQLLCVWGFVFVFFIFLIPIRACSGSCLHVFP